MWTVNCSVGELLQCQECKRHILVERVLNGSNHTLGTLANCWDCLDEDTKKKAREAYGIAENKV